MPIRYEDRSVSELKQLAKKKGIVYSGKTKAQLIVSLRHKRDVKPVSIRKSKERLKRYERCVKKVKSKSPKVNPWAVCHASVYGRKK